MRLMRVNYSNEHKEGWLSELPQPSVGVPRILIFNDVHLMHEQTPTWIIIENLMFLINKAIEKSVKVFVVPGDLFDERGSLEDERSHLTIEFSNWLLVEAKKHNITIILVEGTPKHDRKQYKVLLRLNKNIGVDVKYYTDITIHHEPKLNLVFGLIPDEYRDNAADTTKLFKELMKSSGYNKLDAIFLHGLCNFQIPHIKSIANFCEKVLTKLTKYGVFIAHDHNEKLYSTDSVKARVLGSSDCLSHGEVGNKGVNVVDFTEKEAIIYHLVNPSPCQYITVEGTGKSSEQIVNELEAALKRAKGKRFFKEAKFRVTYPHDCDLKETIKSLSETYGIKIKATKLPNKDKILKVNQAFLSKVEEGVLLDKETIRRKLLERSSFSESVTTQILEEVEGRI